LSGTWEARRTAALVEIGIGLPGVQLIIGSLIDATERSCEWNRA
jgi:hypothetical protein